MDPPKDVSQTHAIEDRHRHELQREFAVMVLYVSIVLLAALVALPAGYGTASGQVGPPLILIVWGTAVGLALAHWFAFVVAAAGFRGGQLHRHDVELATVHVAGAAVVALATTVAIVVAPESSEVRAAVFVPAGFIGLAGFRVARSAGRSRAVSGVAGVIALVLGLVVAGVKNFLSH